jgi:hypothetical protein
MGPKSIKNLGRRWLEMQMKPRMFRLVADDGDILIDINITVVSHIGYSLEEEELDKFEKSATRRIAEVLASLPHSDFGIENIRIESPRASKRCPGKGIRKRLTNKRYT